MRKPVLIASVSVVISALASLSPAAPASSSADIPDNLVVDFRLYEMRSSNVNFQAMSELTFFVDTDGMGITEAQWLGTIARQVPDAFLASLAFDSVPVEGTTASFELDTRSRTIELTLDLSGFLDQGTFPGSLSARLARSDEVIEAFTTEVELRNGQTFVMSSHDLELAASDYLSHFRDYEDADHRGELYSYLRNYSIFLIVAMTPRVAAEGLPERIDVGIPEDEEIPELVSPAGVRLVGTIVLEFDVDAGGVPQEIRIARSSIPEVTPRILGALEDWRFPDHAGRAVRLKLDLEAPPAR